MKKSINLRGFSAYRIWAQLPGIEISYLPDVLMFGAAIALFYGVLVVGRTWLGPFTPEVEISRSPLALVAYAGYSLLRITIAYVLSLAFTLVYGYVAAYNPRAERFMIPLLDVLQSIPVLSFLPGVMLAMVALFPGRQLGVEAGAILLIFTGQVWNMAFSFYASLKSIPKEMREAAKVYQFSWWQRFIEMELPFAAIGLVWNSMMSVAGGWFFLMACEMFVLGSRDFRLPGLGSYLQTAASAGDTRSILWGVGTMIAVIVLLDQFIWRPVIAWAEKFKVEQVESSDAPRSWVLDLIRHSRSLAQIRKKTVRPLSERVMLYFSRPPSSEEPEPRSAWKTWLLRALAVVVLAGISYGVVRVVMILSGLQKAEVQEAGIGLVATFRARQSDFAARRVVDDPGRCGHWLQSAAGADRAAPGADRRFGSRDGAVSSSAAVADSRGRRTRDRLDRAPPAGNAVVHPVQRDRRRDRDSDRPEGVLLGLPNEGDRTLEKADPAGNLSVSHHGHGHGIGWSVECQHRRRILSFQRPHLYHSRARRHDFSSHRCRQFRPAAGRHHDDGRDRGHDQSPGVAQTLRARRNPLPTRNLTRLARPEWLPLVTFVLPQTSFHQLLTCTSCWRNASALLV